MKFFKIILLLIFILFSALALSRIFQINRDKDNTSINHAAEARPVEECSLEQISLVKLQLSSFTKETTSDYANLEDITFYYNFDKDLSAVDIERVGDTGTVKATAYICENEITWLEIQQKRHLRRTEDARLAEEGVIESEWHDYRTNKSTNTRSDEESRATSNYFYERSRNIYNQAYPERSN